MGRSGSLTVERQRPDVTLRAARADDVSLIRSLRNDADAVRFSMSARAVSEAEHARWFEARLADSRTHLWVAEERGIPVGQVRVDLDGGVGVLSIAVVPAARGRGVAQALLGLALAEIERLRLVGTVTALTHPENLRSIYAFEKVGFRRREISGDGFVILELQVRQQPVNC